MYFGLTLINLINKKHTAEINLEKPRTESSLPLKFFLISQKKNYAKLAINALL